MRERVGREKEEERKRGGERKVKKGSFSR